MEEVGVGTLLRVPFGRRRLLGVVVELAERSELPPERLAEPIEALEAGVAAGAGAARALGRARVLLDPVARSRLVLPPGTGPGPRRGAGSSCGRGDPRAGEAALERGERSAPASGRSLEPLRRGRAVGAPSSRRCGADRAALRRLEGRDSSRPASAEVRRRPRTAAVGRPRAGRSELDPAAAAAVARLVAALDGEAGR